MGLKKMTETARYVICLMYIRDARLCLENADQQWAYLVSPHMRQKTVVPLVAANQMIKIADLLSLESAEKDRSIYRLSAATQLAIMGSRGL